VTDIEELFAHDDWDEINWSEIKSRVRGYIRCVDPYSADTTDESDATRYACSLVLKAYFKNPPEILDINDWKRQFRRAAKGFLTEIAMECYCDNAYQIRFHGESASACSAMVKIRGKRHPERGCMDVAAERCDPGERTPRTPNAGIVFSIAGICNNTNYDETARRAIREELLDGKTGIQDNATALVFGILTEGKLGDTCCVTDRRNPLNRFMNAAKDSLGPEKIDSERFFPAAQRLMRDAQGSHNLNLTKEKVRSEFVGRNGFSVPNSSLVVEDSVWVAASTQAYRRLGELFDQIFT